MTYGFCPQCGAAVTTRERRINGNDTCANGHVYPSRDTKKTSEAANTITAQIGDGPTPFGLDFHGLIRVERACASRNDERRKWASIVVTLASGTRIEIDATPRKHEVRINGTAVSP